jgi:hypothetical protein
VDSHHLLLAGVTGALWMWHRADDFGGAARLSVVGGAADPLTAATNSPIDLFRLGDGHFSLEPPHSAHALFEHDLTSACW